VKLSITPLESSATSVISQLLIDGTFECYVLEPQPPIPAGVYDVKLLHSVKFNRIMPFLLAVPGHTGIEIHWGNTAKDTKDCLLVGRTKAKDFVGESHEAFAELFTKLLAADQITIGINREVPAPITTGVPMKVIDAWFNSTRGHAVGMLVLSVAAQMFPQYAMALQTVAYAFGYGAIVAGAPPKI
jgi:hypothetical protein